MRILVTFWAAALILLGTGSARAKLNVVATTPDLGSIAEFVGGKEVEVTSLARGTEDPHFVDPKPSFIRVLNRADVLIEGGADLEIGWLPPLVNSARNRNILPGGKGRLAGSRGIELLEVPEGPIDRSQGDIHAAGNPHYLLDPSNAKIVANRIAELFSDLDAGNAARYRANAEAFNERIDGKLKEWSKSLDPYRGTRVVTYHKTYDYFAGRFGFVVLGQIEPKPGIEPSPSHIAQLVPEMKQAGAKLVWMEPNRPRRTAAQVAEGMGARVVILPILPGANSKTKDYLALIDYNVEQLLQALPDAN